MTNDNCQHRYGCYDYKYGHCDGCNLARVKMSEICIDCVHQEVCRYECHSPSEHCNDRAVADDFIPQGEWITDSVGNITCSNCGFSLGSKIVKLLYPFDFPYCTDCGAQMKGGADE